MSLIELVQSYVANVMDQLLRSSRGTAIIIAIGFPLIFIGFILVNKLREGIAS